MKKRGTVYLSQSLWRSLLRMTVPAMVASLINGLYTIGDAIFLSKLGPSALGAAAMAFPLVGILGGIGNCFGMGTSSVLSSSMGEGNREKARGVIAVSSVSVLLVGLVAGTFFYVSRIPLLKAFGATGELLALSEAYAEILIFGSIIILLNMSFASIVRSLGNPFYAMTVVVAGACLNIALDPLFMFSLELGVRGAALATIVAQAISMTLLLAKIGAQARDTRTLSIPIKPTLTKIIGIGSPAFFANGLITLDVLLMNRFAASYGEGNVAVIGITFRLMSFIIFPLFGFVQGFLPLAAYAHGGKDTRRLRGITVRAVSAITVLCVVISISLGIAAGRMAMWFFEDPVLTDLAAYSFRISLFLLPLAGLALVASGFYQAVGHPVPAATIAVTRLGAGFIPIMLLLERLFAFKGIIMSFAAAEIVSIAVLAVFLPTALKILNAGDKA